MKCDNIRFTQHAFTRMFERGISQKLWNSLLKQER